MYSFLRFATVSVLAVAGAGCSVTLPVRGQVQNSPETFRGTATGHLDGGGNLHMVSSKVTVCQGNFVCVNHRQGEGVFNCDDQRSGPFTFVSTGRAGTGYGTLGGDRRPSVRVQDVVRE
jgi:hypothetical protein